MLKWNLRVQHMVEKIEKDETNARKSVQKEIGPLVEPLLPVAVKKGRGGLNGRQEVTFGKGSDDGKAWNVKKYKQA